MINPSRTEEGPGRRGSRPGPSVPWGSGGSLGERRSHYKQRGANRDGSAPLFPFLKCPHTRKEKISNSDDEIAAWLGREQAKSKGHSGGVSARVAFETNCRIDPVPLVATLEQVCLSVPQSG